MKQTTFTGEDLVRAAHSPMMIIDGLQSKPELNGLVVRPFQSNPQDQTPAKEGRTMVASSKLVPVMPSFDSFQKGRYNGIKLLSIADKNLVPWYGVDPWFDALSFCKRARFKPMSTGRKDAYRKRMKLTDVLPEDWDDDEEVHAVYLTPPQTFTEFNGDGESEFENLSCFDCERIVLPEKSIIFVSDQSEHGVEPHMPYTLRAFAPDPKGFQTDDLLEALRNFLTGEAELERGCGEYNPDHCFFEGLRPAGRDSDGVLRVGVHWGS